MNILQFKETHCKHCYKCIRKCPIKSIQVKEEHAKIIERECVLCGQCFEVCPQNAKIVRSDLTNIINLIKMGEPVYVSLAPSYVAAFPGISFEAMSANLKKIGFAGVEETSIGAGKVTKEYERLLEEGKMTNIITTCCPTINLLIEKYFPKLICYMAPVASPAVIHGRLLKKIYGEHIKVVFIGPCISKKYEVENSDSLDGVILFDELYEMIPLKYDLKDENKAEIHNTINRFYPMPGGILKTVNEEKKKNYAEIAVDGMERCIQILTELSEDFDGKRIKNHFIEMSACKGSCINGPGLKNHTLPMLQSRECIASAACKKTEGLLPETEAGDADYFFEAKELQVDQKIPSTEELAKVLLSMGKTDESMLYNCGACGYNTCKEKAVAVWQGKAEVKMCVPFMWSKMESQANLVFENSLSGIVLVDENFSILEYNYAAAKMFDLQKYDHKGLPLLMLFDSNKLEKEVQESQGYYNEIQLVESSGITIDITVVWVEHNEEYILFIRDITEDIMQKKKMEDIREQTLETAQKVIDKQMRTAQEIASLLGETTGETKIALINLKNAIADKTV